MKKSLWIISIFVSLVCVAYGASAQDLAPKPLDLPKPAQEEPKFKITGAHQPTEQEQVAECRAQADQGNNAAAFQMALDYLLGLGVSQDEAEAAKYLAKTRITPARACLLAESYMESSLPKHRETAMDWAFKAQDGCADWMRSRWFAGNSLGPDQAKEIEFLRKGLEWPRSHYKAMSEQRMGELLLQGVAIEAPAKEKTRWIGAAARGRMGATELQIAQMYFANPAQQEAPETPLEWLRNAARYNVPPALAALGTAAVQRQVSDLSYLDGLALTVLGVRQDVLSAPVLDDPLETMDSAAHEELDNALAAWARVAQETGGYYTQRDALRAAPEAGKDGSAGTTAADPDAQLRRAYVLESAGELELLEVSAGYGSRPACTLLAKIDGSNLAQYDNRWREDAYMWLRLSGTKNAALLNQARQRCTEQEQKEEPLAEAYWIQAHKDFWPVEWKTAQAFLESAAPKASIVTKILASDKPRPTIAELKVLADKGDTEAAYQVAVRLLSENTVVAPDWKAVEHYAALGALDANRKVRVRALYNESESLDAATRRDGATRWFTAAGGSMGPYHLGEMLYGKADGEVISDDQKSAVEFWQKAVDGGEERWARLARMKLGYCVVKGWSSGNRAKDAAWAHELAMEFLGRNLYDLAGDYSYGRELAHDEQHDAFFTERAAIYNHDNAQGQIAKSILDGKWTGRDEADAYAWMRLRAVKQDQADTKKLEQAEQDAALKVRIDARYNLLWQTRRESGAYFPQNDPLRVATRDEMETQAAQFDPEAQLRLGTWLEKAADAASLERAVALYRTIWANSSWETRLTWGRALMRGAPGLARDDKAAVRFLLYAATSGSRQNSLEACKDLAVLAAEGRGGEADPVQAEVWRELAEESSAAPASFTEEQRKTVAERVAEWRTKHQPW